MSERLIFVSCGQLTVDERRLGQRIKAEIDTTEGYSAYFAAAVQSLEGLSNHILDAIRRCSGAVVVMHRRERITTDAGDNHCFRSSIWINQEVAILAYRQHFEGTNIPLLAFKHPDIKIEGAMTAFIVNPLPLDEEDRVLKETRKWLQTAAHNGQVGEQEVFDRKWEEVNSPGKAVLKALIAEGGRDVKDISVRRRLTSQGTDKNQVSEILRNQRQHLSQINLIRVTKNSHDGDELSLHPAWERYVRHEIGKLT